MHIHEYQLNFSGACPHFGECYSITRTQSRRQLHKRAASFRNALQNSHRARNWVSCRAPGPAKIPVPRTTGCYVDEAEQYGWRIYRVSSTLLLMEDCGNIMVQQRIASASTKERKVAAATHSRFISWTHRVLLRRLGRQRVIWLMHADCDTVKAAFWRGNIDLVTGFKKSWLEDRDRFQCVENSESQVVPEVVL